MDAYAKRLEIDRDGTVTLIDPIGPDDDSEFTTLGHVASGSTADACPDELQGDLRVLYADWIDAVAESPGGGGALRRMHLAGELR